MQAEAELALDEGLKLAPLGAARVVPKPRFLTWYPTIGATVAIVLGGMLYAVAPWLVALSGWRDWTDWVLMAVGLSQLMLVAIGLAAGWNLAVRHHQRAFLKGLRERGAPAAQRFTYTIEEQGLVAASERASHTLRWPAILEVVPAPDHWLFLQDTLTYNVPKRAFASRDHETAFLREVLARIPAPARERSREAREFAGV